MIHSVYYKIINYENVFPEDNKEIYLLIKPFISFLPDFRPLDTVNKMKNEEQNNWRILYDEITVLTSKNRKKERELVKYLIQGPEDIQEIVVTRNKNDFPDFFDSYQALSYLIPYISECLYNVDNFFSRKN